MGLFGLQRVPCGPLWRDFVLLFGWLSVFFCLVASCLHAKHKKIMARSGLCPFLVLDLPFFRGFWGQFSAHCGAFGIASSGSPALQICPVSWVSCGAGGSDRLGLGFLIGAPSGSPWCFHVCFFDMSFCALCGPLGWRLQKDAAPGGWPRRGSCCVFGFLIVARIGAAGGWSGAGGRLSVFAACASNLGVYVAFEGIRKPTRTGSAGSKYSPSDGAFFGAFRPLSVWLRVPLACW